MQYKGKGKITISRVSCGGEEDFINITLMDESSCVEFVDVKIDLKTYAHAISGMSHQEVEFELRHVEKVGKKREHKTVLVKTDDIKVYGDDFAKEVRKRLKEMGAFEDGWTATEYDCRYNHHRSSKGNLSVSLIRFVQS